jgi:two-component system response regulator WspF
VRVAIVNDVRLAVEALRRVLAMVPGCEVAWTAADGAEAVTRCAGDRPDLVLMDLVMPGMDGVEATRRIMQATPCHILVVTSTVEGHLERVYNALSAGALDAVQGPVLRPDGTLDGSQPVVRKIRTLQRLKPANGAPAPAATDPEPPGRAASPGSPAPAPAEGRGEPIVALGASTGGPEALVTVLRGFSKGFSAPVLVIQHLDVEFVPGLVDWMASQTGRVVQAAQVGRPPERGKVHVACSNDHLVVAAGGALRYVAEPVDLPYRPSVDVCFQSLATGGAAPGAAALLTGMGRDGAEGLLALKRAGWRTFAQDEATSVVYGMPRAAKELGAAQEVLPLTALGPALEAAFARRSGAGRAAEPAR